MKKIKKFTICLLLLLSLFLFLKDKNTTQAFSATAFRGVHVTPYQSVETLNLPEGANRSFMVTHIGSRVVIYPINYTSYKNMEDLLRFNNPASNSKFYQKSSHSVSYCTPAVYSQIVPNANFMNGFPIMFIKQ